MIRTVLLILFLAANLEARTVAGKVIAVEGTVKAMEAASAARALLRGAVIYVGDTIDVDEGGKIQIRFTDGTLTNLAEVTQFVVQDYVFKHKRDTDRLSTELLVGGCRMLTGNIAKERPKDFTIKTPVATIGVLGTYLVISFRNGNLEVACTAGTAYIENEKGIVTIGVGQPTQYAVVTTQTTGTQTTTGGVTTGTTSGTSTSGTAAGGAAAAGAGGGAGGVAAPGGGGGGAGGVEEAGEAGAEEPAVGAAPAPQAVADPPEGIAEVTEDTQMPAAFPLTPVDTTGKTYIQGGC